MAMSVIDLFQTVHIGHHQPQTFSDLAFAIKLQLLLGVQEKTASVVKPGQVVSEREAFQFFVGLL
jgi:hypothetical protein